MLGRGDLLARAADEADGDDSFECAACGRFSSGDCVEVDGRLFCQFGRCQDEADALRRATLTPEEERIIAAFDAALELALAAIATDYDHELQARELDLLAQVARPLEISRATYGYCADPACGSPRMPSSPWCHRHQPQPMARKAVLT
jgi:hypothetical protein